MEKEMFMNEKRLIFFSPETPDKIETDKWIKIQDLERYYDFDYI